MAKTDKKAFFYATGLHVLVLAIAVYFAFFQTVRTEEMPHVFELVNDSAEPVPMPAPPAPSTPPVEEEILLKAPEVPMVKPLPAVKVPTIPDAPPPPPAPAPTKPTPTPTAPPVPAPKPTPPPPPAPVKVSADEFFKQHGRPQPRQTAPAPAPTPVKAPVIQANTQQLRQISEVRSQSAAAPSARELAALESYLAALRQRVNAAWDRPNEFVNHDIQAVVEFNVSRTGQVSGARIIKSSGNAHFDRSVLQSFARITQAGKPPENRDYTFRMTFRMREA